MLRKTERRLTLWRHRLRESRLDISSLSLTFNMITSNLKIAEVPLGQIRPYVRSARKDTYSQDP